MAKAGIKLSNLHLRDGNGDWHSLDKAYIGDILGSTVESTKLNDWINRVQIAINNIPQTPGGGAIDLTRLFFEKTSGDNSKLQLRYRTSNDNEEITSKLITEIDLHGLNGIDSNTTYSLSKETRQGSDNQPHEYLIFKEDGAAKAEILLPEGGGGGGIDFTVTSGYGIFTEGGSGGGSGGSGSGITYTGDNRTISISDNTISMVEQEPVQNTAGNVINLNYGDTFTAISSIVVDKYGRVTSITKQTYKLPAADSIMNITAVQNQVKTYAQQEIDKMLDVT